MTPIVDNYGLDDPKVFNAADINIPSSVQNPIQVVASLPVSCEKIHVFGSINQYIGVYVGPPGQEIWVATITGGAPSEKRCYIGAKSRICLRSMFEAVTTGTISIQFSPD